MGDGLQGFNSKSEADSKAAGPVESADEPRSVDEPSSTVPWAVRDYSKYSNDLFRFESQIFVFHPCSVAGSFENHVFPIETPDYTKKLSTLLHT
jgi:hypothetical protein